MASARTNLMMARILKEAGLSSWKDYACRGKVDCEQVKYLKEQDQDQTQEYRMAA